MKRNANSRKNVFGTCKSMPSYRAERQKDSLARRKGSKTCAVTTTTASGLSLSLYSSPAAAADSEIPLATETATAS